MFMKFVFLEIKLLLPLSVDFLGFCALNSVQPPLPMIGQCTYSEKIRVVQKTRLDKNAP